MTDQEYFNTYISKTFPVKKGQPNNWQGFHHHVKEKQKKNGLNCTLIRSQLITIMANTRKLPQEEYQKVEKALNTIEHAINKIQGI